MLFRLRMPAPAKVGEVIAGIIGRRENWPGHFFVVEADRIRMRTLPSA